MHGRRPANEGLRDVLRGERERVDRDGDCRASAVVDQQDSAQELAWTRCCLATREYEGAADKRQPRAKACFSDPF